MRKYAFIFAPILFGLLGGCAGQSDFTVETVAEYNSLFSREDGWTGGDVAFSLPLGENRILWLFGDTWIGKVRGGKHVDSEFINNTIAIQEGKEPSKIKLDFYYSVKNGKHSSFMVPDDGKGFFWPDHGGVRIERGLYLVMNRIARNSVGGDALDFKEIGLTMARIPNPEDHPSKWRIIQRDIPWTGSLPGGNKIAFGYPLLQAGGMVYIYGMEMEKTGDRHLLLARAPEDSLDDFKSWRFYSAGKWQDDFTKASRLADRLGAELSVSYQPVLREYVAVYTERGLSKNIMLRFAPAPEGPWSRPYVVYECPEADWDKDYFCYAAKGHSELSRTDDELLISYVCNAHDFWKMAADARIYRPKFIRVRFRKSFGASAL